MTILLSPSSPSFSTSCQKFLCLTWKKYHSPKFKMCFSLCLRSLRNLQRSPKKGRKKDTNSLIWPANSPLQGFLSTTERSFKCNNLRLHQWRAKGSKQERERKKSFVWSTSWKKINADTRDPFSFNYAVTSLRPQIRQHLFIYLKYLYTRLSPEHCRTWGR